MAEKGRYWGCLCVHALPFPVSLCKLVAISFLYSIVFGRRSRKSPKSVEKRRTEGERERRVSFDVTFTKDKV